jgi:hypothetical protein
MIVWSSRWNENWKGNPKWKMKSLCFTNWALCHEGVWGSGCIDPHFLDLGTSWRWVVSFTPLSLYPREGAPCTYWIGGWMGPRAGLDDLEKRKFLTLPGLELRPLDRPARSQSLYRLRSPSSWKNRSTRRKPAPAPICPPQIAHYLTWARTRAAAVGWRRLTAWSMTPPHNRSSL